MDQNKETGCLLINILCPQTQQRMDWWKKISGQGLSESMYSSIMLSWKLSWNQWGVCTEMLGENKLYNQHDTIYNLACQARSVFLMCDFLIMVHVYLELKILFCNRKCVLLDCKIVFREGTEGGMSGPQYFILDQVCFWFSENISKIK